MIRLSKDETKNAELGTTPIMNILYSPTLNKPKLLQKAKNLLIDNESDHLKTAILNMFNWTYLRNMKTTKERKNHLIKKFGAPNYHANYEYREAIWGFKYQEIEIVIYYSTKGFSVQVSPDCTITQARVILENICATLEQD